MDAEMFQPFIKLPKYAPPSPPILSQSEKSATESATSSTKDDLTNIEKHRRVKNSENSKRFQCSTCLQPFEHEDNAIAHVYTHMSREELAETDIFHLDCGFCGRIFLNGKNYLVHLKTHMQTSAIQKKTYKSVIIRQNASSTYSDTAELLQAESPPPQESFKNEANAHAEKLNEITVLIKTQDHEANGENPSPANSPGFENINPKNCEKNLEDDWATELVLAQIYQQKAEIKDLYNTAAKIHKQNPPTIKAVEEPVEESASDPNWTLNLKNPRIKRHAGKSNMDLKLARELTFTKIAAEKATSNKMQKPNNAGIKVKFEKPFTTAIIQTIINQKKKILLKEDFKRRRELVLKYVRIPTTQKDELKRNLKTAAKSPPQPTKYTKSLARKPSKSKNMCYFCSKRLSRKDSMYRHLVMHIKETPFKCPSCKNDFMRREDLQRHSKSHGVDGGRIFLCSFCPSKFTRKASKIRHEVTYCKIRAQHQRQETVTFSGINEKLNPLGKHFCYFCWSNFSDTYHLNRHLLTHTRETPYKCNMCSRQFASDSNLHGHNKSCCKNRIKFQKFECGDCKWEFQNELELKLHRVWKVCEENKILGIKCIKL